jgi:thiol:disulfide interchange protein
MDANNVALLKADLGAKSQETKQEIKDEMKRLGNPLEMLPYYAVYAPGLSEPITISGSITSGKVIRTIEDLGAAESH